MSDIPEQAIDAAANVVGEVADQVENLEDTIRSLNRVKIAFAALGFAAGTATGAFVAWRVAWAKSEAAASKIADDEIARMAEHYHSKIVAAEAQATKLQPVKEIVVEKGYATPEADEGQPMVVTPPAAVVEAAKEAIEEAQPAKAKVVKEPQEHAEVKNVFQEHGDSDVDRDWDYVEERKNRSPDKPYIIHQDERGDFEDYDEHTITYYEADDVLCNERDEIIDPMERDALVGEASLSRFGHGSTDPDIVYVRNDRLENIYEIVKSPNAFAEEVHGFTHDSHDRENLRRMRDRERRLLDDD